MEGAGITGDDLVIEIGPGIGVLTARAAEAAGRVVAVEIDEKLIPILAETLVGYDNIRVINRGHTQNRYKRDHRGRKKRRILRDV